MKRGRRAAFAAQQKKSTGINVLLDDGFSKAEAEAQKMWLKAQKV